MCFKFYKFPWLQKLNGAGQAFQLPAWLQMKIIVAPAPCQVSERVEIHPKWHWRRSLPQGNALCSGKVMPKPHLFWGREEVASLADTDLSKSWLEKQGRVCKAWVVPAGGQAGVLEQQVLVSVVLHKSHPWLAVGHQHRRKYALYRTSSPIWQFKFDLFISPK